MDPIISDAIDTGPTARSRELPYTRGGTKLESSIKLEKVRPQIRYRSNPIHNLFKRRVRDLAGLIMGRRKVEIKKIEDKSSRLVTFSKRRSGLIKKSRDLSVLCEADVALVFVSSAGKLYEFSRSGTDDSLASIIRRYWSHNEAEGKVPPGDSEERAGYLTTGELLQIVERHTEEPNIEEPSITDLVQLENQIDSALSLIRSRKTQLMMKPVISLLDKERILREENALLEQVIATRNEMMKKKKHTCSRNKEAVQVILGFNNGVVNGNQMNLQPHPTLDLLPL